MSDETKAVQEGISELIRAEIAKIPISELRFAKPARVLPLLEKAGMEITPSVRSTASKLLKKKRKEAASLAEGEVISFDPTANMGNATRRELAMRLVEACDGDFEIVRAEIARLEEFAKKIKRA